MKSWPLNPRNPGEFLAGCGLSVLAGVGATSRWSPDKNLFLLDTGDDTPEFDARKALLALCEECGKIKVTKGGRKKVEQERKEGETHEETAPPEPPIPLTLPGGERVVFDWWCSGDWKLWGGQARVSGILKAIAASCSKLLGEEGEPDLFAGVFDCDSAAGFGLDAASGWTALDVGFSPDKAGIPVELRPLIHLSAFVGMQWFAPVWDAKRTVFRYASWHDFLGVPSARVAMRSGLPNTTPWSGTTTRRGKSAETVDFSEIERIDPEGEPPDEIDPVTARWILANLKGYR